MDEAIEIRRGTAAVTLTPSTEADIAYVNAHLRPWDKFEQDHFRVKCGVGKVDTLDLFERCWTLRMGGDILGFAALSVPPGQTVLSPNRYVPMLSTVHADAHRIDFARLTRQVLRFVVAHAPEWVTNFYSLPLAKYEATVRWHEKTMGWHRVAVLKTVGGEKAILFHLTRKEVLG